MTLSIPGDHGPRTHGPPGAMPELLAQLAAHQPRDADESRSLIRTRRLLHWLPAPFDQHADPTHVTGSAIVLDPDGRVLLHRHKRLHRWLQPGGHLDPGEAPWQAAVRETREETGVAAVHASAGPRLIHVDVHEGPRGHVHLDLRYLLTVTAPTAPAPQRGESPHASWWPAHAAAERSDRSTVAALAAALLASGRSPAAPDVPVDGPGGTM